MYKCKEFESRTEDYIDNLLKTDEIKEFESHLESCVSCRENLDFAIAVRKMLKSVELPNAPADFVDRVNAAIDSEVIIAPKNHFNKRFFNWRTYSTVAACLLIAAALGIDAEKMTDSISPTDNLSVGISNNAIISNIKIPDIEKNDIEPQNENNTVNNIQKHDYSDKTTEKKDSHTTKKKSADIQKTVDANSNQNIIVEQGEEPPISDVEHTETPKLSEIQTEKSQNNIPPNIYPSYAPVQSTQRPMPYSAGGSDMNIVAEADVVNKSNQREMETAASNGPLLNDAKENTSSNVLQNDILKSVPPLKKLSIASDRLQDARKLALNYGTYENDIYTMTNKKYNEFLTALDNKEIKYLTAIDDEDDNDDIDDDDDNDTDDNDDDIVEFELMSLAGTN